MGQINTASVSRKNSFANIAKMKVATIINAKNSIGEFLLVDTENKQFDQNNFYGEWTLLFFGYRKCPEICPRTLNLVKEAWRKIENTEEFITKENKKIKFVFASLVPEIKEHELESFRKFLTRMLKILFPF